jgi:hypothetical protein
MKHLNFLSKSVPSEFIKIFSHLYKYLLAIIIILGLQGSMNSLLANDSCPGKSDSLKIKIAGSLSTGFIYSGTLTLKSLKKEGKSTKLEFEKDGKNLTVLFSHFPDTSPLKKNQTYKINRKFAKSIGGIVHNFYISDSKGVLLSFSNTKGNPAIPGLKIAAKTTKVCHYRTQKSGVTEALAEFIYDKKTIAKIYAGKSGDLLINKKKYKITVVTSRKRRKVSKKVAFEGPTTKVSYYLVRL